MNHYMTKRMVNRLFKTMKEKDVSTSQMCKAIGCQYCDFKATIEGKSPMYNKWQKKICEALGVERDALFPEFKADIETITRKDMKVMYVVTRKG